MDAVRTRNLGQHDEKRSSTYLQRASIIHVQCVFRSLWAILCIDIDASIVDEYIDFTMLAHIIC